MKKTIFGILTTFSLILCPVALNAQEKTYDHTIESTSSVNWITRSFVSKIALDTQKAQLQMPSGKKKASASIITKMPQLIQPPLFCLFTDNTYCLADNVISDEISVDEVNTFIMNGHKTPDVFSNDIKKLNTTNTLNINKIGAELVNHRMAYTPEEPIDTVPSRPYSGIIIDARGQTPVHGEYIKDYTYPSFFPVIWDENMNIVYEKSMVDPVFTKENGEVGYHYSDDVSLYADRVGVDPLYIRASKVYGRNRTDPIISRRDALKILSVPENVELMKNGKVVILLDKQNLIYNIATPDKDEEYYVKYQAVKHILITNAIPDVEVTDDRTGIKFSVKLKFYPDSPVLLPEESVRINAIAQQLKDLLLDDGYTILVEGHTADVGKPIGQLNLSIERTQTVMNALIDQGIERNLFTYKGYGGTMPVDTNLTEEGRIENRRVEITARPRQTYIQVDW
ncbi:MAG: OmpA family protein [Treponema sp.]|nr:OmpA family protein [Treponema sp.]